MIKELKKNELLICNVISTEEGLQLQFLKKSKEHYYKLLYLAEKISSQGGFNVDITSDESNIFIKTENTQFIEIYLKEADGLMLNS